MTIPFTKSDAIGGRFAKLATLSLAAVSLGTALPSCMVHSVDHNPKPPIDLPKEFDALGKEGDPGRWWSGFADSELDRLIAAALENNLQIKQAWARVDQMEAIERLAAAGLFPTVDAQLQASRAKSAPRIFNLPGAGEREIPGVEANNFSASLPVSYELDVWGRVRSGMFAAEQDVLAMRDDVQTVATTVAANVTERWFDVVEQRARKQLLVEQLEISRTLLELVTLRFGQGQANLSDVLQQRQQLQALEAQLILAEGAESVANRQLAVLVGKSPKAILSGSRVNLPKLPPLPETGVPAGMLLRRPDLRAARRRVVAADYRVGEAIANRFPQLHLSGSLGFNTPDLSSFFESFVWNFVGSITGSIWDGGRRAAEVDRTKAVLDERLYAYGDALLNALLEVESTLVRTRFQEQQLAVLDKQVQTAERTLAAARTRFAGGLTNFLPTLTALNSLQVAQQNKLNAQRQMLSLRVQLYRTLGSRWTENLERPKRDDDDDDDGKAKGTEKES